MASIRPFQGLRFTPSAGELDSNIAPAYDAMSPEQREAYRANSEYNIVHLTLPEAKPDDRSKYVRYARSAAALSLWRREGFLIRDPKPAIYVIKQTFKLPGREEELTRTSFVCLLKLEPFENEGVISFEPPTARLNEDRLRILEATRAHLEPIFGLYEDPAHEIGELLALAPLESVVETTDGDGVHHSLAVVTDQATIDAIKARLSSKSIWIGDGRHRYETALAFRQAVRDPEGEVPEDYIPIALTSMSDPGLVLSDPVLERERSGRALLPDDLKTIALASERTSPKSTYYSPMVQSGFVLWSLNDF
jgi:uncharacterized protein (DUF1015 family)